MAELLMCLDHVLRSCKRSSYGTASSCRHENRKSQHHRSAEGAAVSRLKRELFWGHNQGLLPRRLVEVAFRRVRELRGG